MTRVCPHSDTKCPHGMTCKYSCATGEYNGTKTMTLTPQEIADGWIPHDGGANPARGLTGDVRFKDGDVMSGPFDKHADTRWENDLRIFLGSHIIAYRLADAEPNTPAEPCYECGSTERIGTACAPCNPEMSAEPVGDGGMPEVMTEALRPFDVIGIPEWPDDEKVWLSCDGNSLGFIKLGDFRRLAALRPAEPVGDDGMREAYEFPYQRTFNAIADAVTVQGNQVGISVAAFQKSFSESVISDPAQAPEGLEVVAWRFKFPEDNRWKYSQIDPIAYATNVSPLTDHATATRLLAEKDARIAELEADRDAALRECSKWATEAGLAMGKLETSELAGVVDDWRARATAAEARVSELEIQLAAESRADTLWITEHRRALAAEAEVERLREVLEPLVEIAESVTDEGPDGEGWKSHKLLTLISKARQALATGEGPRCEADAIPSMETDYDRA